MTSAQSALIAYALDGTIIGWNRGAELLFGYRATEVLGQSLGFLRPAELPDAEIAHWQLWLQNGAAALALHGPRCHRDGHAIDVRGTRTPVRDALNGIVAVTELWRPAAAHQAVPAPIDSEHYLKRELYARIRTHPELFDFLQSGSLDGIWYWDLENPEHEWMSPRLKEVLGYRDDEVPNTSDWWQQQIFPEDLNIPLDNFRRHCDDPQHPYDQIIRYRHRDGSTVWIRCRGIVLRDGNGRPTRMLGAHTDVTAIKRAEERFRALHEALPDIHFVADIDGLALVREGNRWFAEATGRDAGELLGCSLFELCDASSQDALRELLALLQTQPLVRNYELTLRHQNGMVTPLILSASTEAEADQRARRMRCWCRDITPLRQVANVEVLIETMPSSVVLVNEAGLIVGLNHNAETMFKVPRDGMIGQPLDHLLPQAFRNRHREHLQRYIRAPTRRSMSSGRDLIAQRSDGSQFPVRIGLNPIPTRDGLFIMATVIDLSERMAIEQALRESERRFRQLVDSLPQLVWTTTAEGACDYLNQQWLDYTGIDSTPQLGIGWLLQVHPDDRAALSQNWQQAVSNGSEFHAEFRIRNRDGSFHWFDTRAVPIRDEHGQIRKWIGTNSDIDSARKAHEALRHQQLWLSKIIATAPGAIYSLRRMPDGRLSFPFCSPAFEALIGLGTANLTVDAGPAFELLHPDDYARILSSIDVSAQEMTPWHSEFRVLHPQKGEVWIEGHSMPQRENDGSVLWHGFLTDITARRRNEEALHESRTQLMAALDAGGMGTAFYDCRNGRLRWDDSLLKLWGRRHDELGDGKSDTALAFVHPEDRARLLRLAEQLLRTGDHCADEYRIVLPNSEVRWLATRARLERDTAGRPLHISAISMDVTARKLSEESALRSQKLEALGTLAGGIAHDFNNILLAISGNTRLAAGDLPSEHPVQSSLAEIATAAARASDLVRRILTFSRPQERRHEVVSVRAIVEEALQLLRPTLPAMIELRTQYDDCAASVAVDATALHQIIVNIATNAAQAIGNQRGTITLSTRALHIDGSPPEDVLSTELQSGRYVELKVADTGCGMEHQVLRRIFDPFFTTKPPGQGTGLGLSFVHSTVKNHGGSVGVRSEVGVGTTFALYFPLTEAARPAPPPSKPEPAAGHGQHILYVDDELALVTLARKILPKLGYRVSGYTDPAAALMAFRDAPQQFDAVVTDLSMPHLSGFELATALLQLRADIPIVMTSGYVRPEDKQKALQIGMRAMILKPDTLEELGKTLARILTPSAP